MKTTIAVLLVAGFPALLGAEDLVLRWKEVPRSLVEGRNVEVRLAGESTLKGKALAVTPSGLQVAITKVRGKGQYKQGESVVPAGDIMMLKVDRSGIRGRIVGTAIGGGISAVALYAFVGISQNEGDGRVGAGVAVSFIPVAVGSLLGWARDRHYVTIHVVQP
jgi:hypothetical protein